MVDLVSRLRQENSYGGYDQEAADYIENSNPNSPQPKRTSRCCGRCWNGYKNTNCVLSNSKEYEKPSPPNPTAALAKVKI